MRRMPRPSRWAEKNGRLLAACPLDLTSPADLSEHQGKAIQSNLKSVTSLNNRRLFWETRRWARAKIVGSPELDGMLPKLETLAGAISQTARPSSWLP